MKKSRHIKGISQSEVAKYLNISRQSISKWENDTSSPDINNLTLLSSLYEISIDDLLKEKKEVKKNIKENSIEIIESKNKLIYLKNNTNRDEGLVLLLISLIGCLISPLGLIIAPVVLKRNKATNTFYKGVIAASVICFTVSLFVS
ncbi:TPA: helix-turn-helix domain-containing protein, partial [Enterococcus faecium]